MGLESLFCRVHHGKIIPNVIGVPRPLVSSCLALSPARNMVESLIFFCSWAYSLSPSSPDNRRRCFSMPEVRQEHWLWINWSFDRGYSSISERNDELNKGYLASSGWFPTPILEKRKDSMWGELTVGRCLMQLGQLRLVKRKLKLNMSRQALYHINVYVSSHFGRSE